MPFPTSVVVVKEPPLFEVKVTVALVAGSEPLYVTKAVTLVWAPTNTLSESVETVEFRKTESIRYVVILVCPSL